MRLELFQRADGAIVALLHGVASEVPAFAAGDHLERLGECRLPASSLSRAYVTALGRNGWAVATGEDQDLLRLAGYVASRRGSSAPGGSLLEVAIDLACRRAEPLG